MNVAKTIHLLIVEDSEDDALLLVRDLRRNGYEVSFGRVDTEETFLHALDTQRWDVIISDHSMPNFSSTRALQLLQSRGRDIPFMIVSGAIGEEAAVEAMKAGAADFFIKGRTARLIPAVERELREVAERRALVSAEENLLQSEDRFLKAFHANPIAIAMLSMEHDRFIDVNNSFLTLFGYTRETIEQHQALPSGLWTVPETFSDLKQLIARDTPVRSFDTTIRTAAGDIRHVLLTGEDIVLDDAPCVLMMLHDVTEYRKAEFALIEQERLRAALAKEHELAEFRTRFMSMASHEFRTPMTVILSSSEILDEYFDQLTEEKRREYLTNIKTQIRHLRGMLSEIEMLVKAESSFLEFHPEQVNLAALCRKILQEQESSIGLTHQVYFAQHGTPVETQADERLMRIIVTNLLSNAAKFSPQGSEIRFELFFLGDTYRIRVQDAGIGIPDEDQKHLFKSFFRARNVTTISGSGIGLNLVRYCVEAHGGTIQFNSKLGKGTTFILDFPVHNML